ncbi:MAG: LacI family DNA-binding transcriptional regulator, partial [Actinomycetota bacterium]
MSPRRPTLRDVSQHTGLSVTQVSRALNGHDDVAESTRRAVEAAAQAIGYVPNMQARQLRMPGLRANAVGIVLPATTLSFSYPFLGSLMAGVIQVASEQRVEVDISTVSDESAELLTYKRAIEQRRVDGFVLLRTRRTDERLAFLQEAGVPWVAFGRADNAPPGLVVDDADDAMAPVVEHLVGLGHRRIGCIAEPDEFARSHHRLRSFLDAMADAGHDVDPGLVVHADFADGSGQTAAERLLDRGEPPTAIVALNDLLALGALSAAYDRGLDVPSDLSITGFDDVPLAALAGPPLTTLRVDAEQMGRELAGRLLDLVDGR